jgi:hydrogenase-4 membrane subunit HyfE
VNPLLIAFVAVLLVPLFVASWRLSLYGLGVQGVLMAAISYQIDPDLSTATAWYELFDLAIVRGIIAPLALYTVLISQRATQRNDVVPPNLMTWTLAIVFVIGGFRFADMLVPAELVEHDFVAVATAALLLGLLVLATQTGPFSQMIGALRIENAIAALELSSTRDDGSLAIKIAQTGILVATILLFRWYLRTLPRGEVTKRSAVEGVER